MSTTNGVSITMNAMPTSATAWNGPVCHLCLVPYVDFHKCSPMDLMRRADFLRELALKRFAEVNPQPTVGPTDRTIGCPCRQENGGSGVCGCTLGGPR